MHTPHFEKLSYCSVIEHAEPLRYPSPERADTPLPSPVFRVLDRGAGLCEPIDVSSGDLRPYLGPEFEHKLKGDNRRFTMFRSNRTMTYLMIAIVGVGLALAFGFNPFFLLLLAICPLMMFFMMRSMGNMGNMGKRDGDDHGSRDTDRDSDDRVDRDANTGR